MTSAVRMILIDIEYGASIDEALARVGMNANDELRNQVMEQLFSPALDQTLVAQV